MDRATAAPSPVALATCLVLPARGEDARHIGFQHDGGMVPVLGHAPVPMCPIMACDHKPPTICQDSATLQKQGIGHKDDQMVGMMRLPALRCST